MDHRLGWLLWMILLTVSQACINKNDAHTIPSQQIRFESDGAIVDSSEILVTLNRIKVPKRFHKPVVDAYARNQWAPIWTDKNGFNQHASMAAAFFWKFLSTGTLDRTRFLPGMKQSFDDCLSENPKDRSIRPTIEKDIAFTSQCLIFFSELMEGKKAIMTSQPEWYIPYRKFSSDTSLKSIGLAQAILTGSPVHRQFIRLTETLSRFQALEKSGGMVQIPLLDHNILPGDSNQAIPKIKRWMHAYGVFDGDVQSVLFDQDFESAVRTTRKSLGLKDTALVDRSLIKSMNVPIRQRIRTIRINLERWKWLPPDSSNTFIRVNIPDFTLEVVENGVLVKKMKVIVGTESNHTVMFSDAIEHVVFSPYWNVPYSIFKKELWPIIRNNPSYLEKHEMEIIGPDGPVDPNRVRWHHYTGKSFPYRIRQKPGAQNALGLIKFSFPNPYGIYMHDTPYKELFLFQKRTFSHGCIRIEDPKWMAGYLLRDRIEWTAAAMDSAMASRHEQFVQLDQPMPVFITYFTAWVNETGTVQFRDDVYGHDAAMDQVMFGTKK